MKTMLMVAAGVVVGCTVVVAVLVQILVQFAPILVAVAVAVLVLRLVRNRRPRQNVEVLPPPAAPWTPPYVAPTPQAPVPATRTAALPTAAAPVEDLYLRWGPFESESPDSVSAFTPRAALPPGRRARPGSRPTGSDRGRRP